jgi:hypothetical protein
MLEERGHKFVWYADGCNIYIKSLRAACLVMEGCVKFLEGKLKLKVNRNKSAAGSPMRLKFLGFSLYWRKEGGRIRVHEKPLKRLVERLKALDQPETKGDGILEELTVLIQGWLGYYRIADIKTCLKRLGEWLRRRIRQIYWKRCKRVRTRYENLIHLGVSHEQAYQ